MSKTESQTRSDIIDRLLFESGWNVTDPAQVVEESHIIVSDVNCVAEPASPYSGHQFSDYVLLGKDRKPLAVVEAKKTSKDAALGREQAKQYCYNIQKQLRGELPFCFYTNGHEIYFWDLDNYPPRKVVGFPTLPGVIIRSVPFVLYWKVSNRKSVTSFWSWPPAPARPAPVSPWSMPSCVQVMRKKCCF